jgi:DNA-binding MarR family transcriptional regulator
MTRNRQDAARRIHSAALHLLRVVGTVDAESGLSPARLSVLSILVFGGRRSVGALAAAQTVRSPTMTALVDGLEAEGLVRRLPHRDDGRSVVVEATARGRRIMRRAQQRRVDLLVQLLEHCSSTEIEQIDTAAEILDRLTRDHIGPATGAHDARR